MAQSRERGTGSVYLPADPKHPGQKLRTYWISYYVDGKSNGWRLSCGVRRSQSRGSLPSQAAAAPRQLQALVRRRGTL